MGPGWAGGRETVGGVMSGGVRTIGQPKPYWVQMLCVGERRDLGWGWVVRERLASRNLLGATLEGGREKLLGVVWGWGHPASYTERQLNLQEG